MEEDRASGGDTNHKGEMAGGFSLSHKGPNYSKPIEIGGTAVRALSVCLAYALSCIKAEIWDLALCVGSLSSPQPRALTKTLQGFLRAACLFPFIYAHHLSRVKSKCSNICRRPFLFACPVVQLRKSYSPNQG
jgi:hypothetical protein